MKLPCPSPINGAYIWTDDVTLQFVVVRPTAQHSNFAFGNYGQNGHWHTKYTHKYTKYNEAPFTGNARSTPSTTKRQTRVMPVLLNQMDFTVCLLTAIETPLNEVAF